MRPRATRRLGPAAATIAAAAAYTLACPPYGVSVAAWLVPGLLLSGTRTLSAPRAAAAGLAFAFVVGLGVTGWARDAAMTHFGLGALAATAFVAALWLLYALPYMFMCGCYAWLGRRMSAGTRPLLGAWLWAGTELVRGAVFSTVPWALLGHTQYQSLWLIQIADLGGVTAVSFLIALVSCTVAETWQAYDDRADAGALAIQRALPAVLVVTATLAHGFHGRLRYGTAADRVSRRVAVVQGSLPRLAAWPPGAVPNDLSTYVAHTRRTHHHPRPDLVIWPEDAIDSSLGHDAMLRRLAVMASRMGEVVLVGASSNAAYGELRSAAYLVDVDGTLREVHDRGDPVPFAAIDGLETPQGPGRHAGGDASRPRTHDVFLLGTIMRREIVEPQVARELVGQGADLLVDLADDSSPPAGREPDVATQLAMAVFRAVETRRYLVHATASGPSGFIDPTGRLYRVLDAGHTGTTVGQVSARSALTPYVRFGDIWLLVVGVGVGLALLTGPGRGTG